MPNILPMLPRVATAQAEADYQLLLTFTNGEQSRYDASPLLQYPVYASLKKVFPQVQVRFGTTVWPGDIDISPDTLYLQSIPI